MGASGSMIGFHLHRLKEVVEVEEVPEKVSVCQLDPLWRRPRPIQEMFRGTFPSP